MIEIQERIEDVLVLEVRGKIGIEDTRQVVPALEWAFREHGRVSLIVRLERFNGWTAGAFLQDLRFELRHRGDFGRVAIVGERRWERLVTRLGGWLLAGEVRFFPRTQEAAARSWVEAGRDVRLSA